MLEIQLETKLETRIKLEMSLLTWKHIYFSGNIIVNLEMLFLKTFACFLVRSEVSKLYLVMMFPT